MRWKPLQIGDLTAPVPIIQGGMGIGVSLSRLASAVAREGGIGIISAAQPGFGEPDFGKNAVAANLRCLSYHIKKAKEMAPGGIIGVNIMAASENYGEYVQCIVDSGADLIISGAGLPMNLPELLKGTNVKFAPIVSPLKSAKVLLKMWDRRYGCVPDFVVIEGPKAGGHLGFSEEELEKHLFTDYDQEILAIMEYIKGFEEKYERKIPVVFGGGVSSREDIDHYMNLGVDGVQIATRFVATEECDADDKFKEAYLNSKAEDIVIIKSPVGLPGRAIRNDFVRLRENEDEKITGCYNCLKVCKPATAPYCISDALIRAVQGDVDNSVIFCGENAWKLDKIVTVHELMQELTDDRL